jgi:lipoyl(octanoyl) transferase
VRIIDCGVMAYHQAYALQERLVAGIAAGTEGETLLLLEHPSVYTIGRGGNAANMLDPSLSMERINRGGDVTWHGPGQVVGYPLINLGRRGRDLHRWLRFLEELLIHTLAAFGIEGHCRQGSTGVWSERGKIAFIGVGVRRWVSMHGFSLNVRPDVRAYERINPCGLIGCPVSSMALEQAEGASVAAVKTVVQDTFEPLLQQHLPQSAGCGRT